MISIVIPTYNRIFSLKKCVESVISQYYDGLEIIIIDDFSSDLTKQWLCELSNRHPFIKILLNNKNCGVNHSRNRGIKEASKDFILFLDSDDKLIDGSLNSLLNSIDDYREVDHFLYIVSYRNDELLKYGVRKIYYSDWLSGSMKGDFTHLVRSSIMKRFLFFEQFRMFEYLNWLRVKRETSPQLLLPIVTTIVDRDREDSLSRASMLNSEASVKCKFEAQHLYYTIYHEDLRQYNSSALTYKLVYSIILGVAAKEKRKSSELIHYSYGMFKALGKIVLILPSSFTLRLIIKYSILKNTIKSN